MTEVPDGVRVATKHFTLIRGGREVLNVHLEPAKVVAVKPAEAPVPDSTDADRRAARHVLDIGGHVKVLLKGSDAAVEVDQLPPGPFELREVNLSDNQAVRDGDLECLAGLEHLESMNLDGCAVGDAGVRHLAGLRALQSLGLGNTLVTGGALLNLRDLPLRHLNLNSCDRLTDEELASLPGQDLETLDLMGVGGVPAQRVKSLARFKHLRRVVFSGAAPSDEDARLLRAAMPGCDVVLGAIVDADPLESYRDGARLRIFDSYDNLRVSGDQHFDGTVFKFAKGDVRPNAEKAKWFAGRPNYILRSKIRIPGSGDPFLAVRAADGQNCYVVYLHRDGEFGILKSVKGQVTVLSKGRGLVLGDGFADFAFFVMGKRLRAVVRQPSGIAALEAEDGDLPDGPPAVGNSAGVAQFKDVEVQFLDRPPAATPK